MEPNKSMMEITVECEECKNRFNLNGTVLRSKTFNILDKPFVVKFYDCPKCGKRYFVQIDNNDTLSAFDDAGRQFAEMCEMSAKGEPIPKWQTNKFAKSRKKLTNKRLKLMKECDGKFIYDYDIEKMFVLKFSV